MYLGRAVVTAPPCTDGTLTAEFQGLILGEHPQSDYLHQTQHHGDDTLIASWLKSWGELAGWKGRDTKLQENKPVDHLILGCWAISVPFILKSGSCYLIILCNEEAHGLNHAQYFSLMWWKEGGSRWTVCS